MILFLVYLFFYLRRKRESQLQGSIINSKAREGEGDTFWSKITEKLYTKDIAPHLYLLAFVGGEGVASTDECPTCTRILPGARSWIHPWRLWHSSVSTDASSKAEWSRWSPKLEEPGDMQAHEDESGAYQRGQQCNHIYRKLWQRHSGREYEGSFKRYRTDFTCFII